MDLLKDKVAVITGACGTLGGAFTKAYVQEGAKVIMTDRQAPSPELEQELKEMGADYIFVPCDITNSEEVKNVFEKAVEKYGTVDILINNAGKLSCDPLSNSRRKDYIELVTKPVEKHALDVTPHITDEEWKSFFEVNVHGTFYCTREALKIMEQHHFGRIINIASTAGMCGQSPFAPHYATSKAAVIGFTKTVAMEAAGDNICVNAIACGGIAAPAQMATLESMGEQGRREFFQMIPLGRLGTPEEYASLAVWLASDGGSYMVGQIISPNGGWVI